MAPSCSLIDHPVLHDFLQETVRAEKGRRNLSWTKISAALAEIGIDQSPSNLSTKVDRGNFSAQFFLALMVVMDVDQLDLSRLAEQMRAHGLDAAKALGDRSS